MADFLGCCSVQVSYSQWPINVSSENTSEMKKCKSGTLTYRKNISGINKNTLKKVRNYLSENVSGIILYKSGTLSCLKTHLEYIIES